VRLQAFRRPTWLFATALLVRVGFFINLFRSTPIAGIWNTGYEACHVAASLASGMGFSSPFGVPTGPTAWVSPVYVGILVAVFKLFGAYSTAAAWTMLLLNALFAALTAAGIYFAGRRIFGDSAGIIAGWIWALMPYAIVMSIKVWETSLSALVVIAGVLMYGQVRNSRRGIDWAAWGGFCGMGVLINPVLAPLYVPLSLGAAIGARRRVALLSISLAAFSAILTPWMARNYFQLHVLLPVRSNFGEELWLGNHPGVSAPDHERSHPLAAPAELASYRQAGEVDFMVQKRRAAFAFINEHPDLFARLTLQRILHFWSSPPSSLWIPISALSWAGLMLAMRRDFIKALPFLSALLLFPIPYYVTHADNWYRHPIEPLMILLAVEFLRRVWLNIGVRGRRDSRTGEPLSESEG